MVRLKGTTKQEKLINITKYLPRRGLLIAGCMYTERKKTMLSPLLFKLQQGYAVARVPLRTHKSLEASSSRYEIMQMLKNENRRLDMH